MSSVSQDDLDFCWERALEHDPWLRLRLVFAGKAQATRLLALHALIASLERTLTMSEESLSIAQLGWWQMELSEEKASHSAHPVIRTLVNSGSMKALAGQILNTHFRLVLKRLQKEPMGDKSALKSFCASVGQARAAAEISLDCGCMPERFDGERCAGTGLSALVHVALRDESMAFWFLPLDLQARHQCDVTSVGQGTKGGRDALRTLRAWGDSWFAEQLDMFAEIRASSTRGRILKKHMVASVVSNRLRFNRTLEMLEHGGQAKKIHWRIRDFVRVWSACRRLTRQDERRL